MKALKRVARLVISVIGEELFVAAVLRYRRVWWAMRSFLGLRENIPGGEKLDVVLLSYKRMKNMPHIVQSLLLCDFVREIVLSNNNPDIRMEDFVRARDPRLKIINQPVRRFPGIRYELARGMLGPYFMCIDDDIFPTPKQVKKIFVRLIANPSVPYGAGGEDFQFQDGRRVAFGRTLPGQEQETDTILWAYAFTREHLQKYFWLIEYLGIDNAGLSSEDVVLSFCGQGKPRSVGMDRLLSCPSSDEPNVALWRGDGFDEHRSQLYLRCKAASQVKEKK